MLRVIQAEIVAVLQKVCPLLPGERVPCETFVSLYLPYVVDLLEHELSPEDACTKLVGLCPADNTLDGT